MYRVKLVVQNQPRAEWRWSGGLEVEGYERENGEAKYDLTLVARYATRVLALHSGRVAAEGPVEGTLSSALLESLFGVATHVAQTPRGVLIDYETIEHSAATPRS